MGAAILDRQDDTQKRRLGHIAARLAAHLLATFFLRVAEPAVAIGAAVGVAVGIGAGWSAFRR